MYAVYLVNMLIVNDIFVRFTMMKLKYIIITLLVEYSMFRIYMYMVFLLIEGVIVAEIGS